MSSTNVPVLLDGWMEKEFDALTGYNTNISKNKFDDSDFKDRLKIVLGDFYFSFGEF